VEAGGLGGAHGHVLSMVMRCVVCGARACPGAARGAAAQLVEWCGVRDDARLLVLGAAARARGGTGMLHMFHMLDVLQWPQPPRLTSALTSAHRFVTLPR
jgi:hypothetical protein